MKTTPRMYARAFFSATDGAKDNELTRLVSSFLRLLEKQRHLRLLPKIVSEYEKAVRRSSGEVDAELSVAFEGNQQHILALLQKSPFLKGTNMRVHSKVDTNLVGGFTLRAGDTLIDASIKKQLSKLKQTLTV